MKTKIALIIGLFALLALGTVIVTADNNAAPISFEQAAQGYVTPMTASCNYFCSKCVPINGGACNAGKSCC